LGGGGLKEKLSKKDHTLLMCMLPQFFFIELWPFEVEFFVFVRGFFFFMIISEKLMIDIL
jgi:hypothetical protein